MSKEIQVTRSSLPPFEEYINEIKDLWETRWLTNMGQKHQKLEEELKRYLKVPSITLFTNGHFALESAIAAFNLTGEVITTPFTFVSTTHAIVRNGLTPVFCDINPDDYTMDPEKIENLITEKTSAIIPVHVYGNICDVNAIDKIAKEYNLKVIYDAAHTFGVTVNGTGVGNFGNASAFSFHATKVFNTIEGGAVTYNDENIKPALDQFKNFGITGAECVDSIGANAKMNEFQAAMGLCNLKYIDAEIEKRKQKVLRYRDNLKDIKGIKLPGETAEINSNYAYFPVIFDAMRFGKTRNEVYEVLKKNNVFTRKYFYPLTNDIKCYDNKFKAEKTPMAKLISESVITLPLYADLEIEEIDRVCEIILGENVK